MCISVKMSRSRSCKRQTDETSPWCKNLLWTYSVFDLLVVFQFWKGQESICWQEQGTETTPESSPYQSPLTLACPCVWAQSPTDSGEYNLVLGLHSSSFACQSAVLHSVPLRIKIRIQIQGLDYILVNMARGESAFFPLWCSILFQHISSTLLWF